MKVVKELTHGILLNYFSIRSQAHLVVSVLTFFDLDAPASPLFEQEMWRFVPRELGPDAVLDAAMPKPKAEVLLRAKCYAPADKPRSAARVAFSVGPISKALNIFGPRFWERRGGVLAITDPQPFNAIDLTWQNAFGGTGYDLNPLGRGMLPGGTAAGLKVVELPAVEDPANLIGAPEDRPAPAGFMPLDQTWPQRRKKAGTYDQKWFREHWPYFPEDINWTFFNTAPEDQQQDLFFEGGEAVMLENMHPERPQVHASLPRLRQRVFVNQLQDMRQPDKGLTFREVQPHLDTVWLFPHALRGILVHRAVLAVADEEAMDVRHLFLVTESPDEAPKSIAHYLAALNKRLDRSVQVDMSQLDAAMAQASEALKQVKDIPKTLAHNLAVVQGQAPDAGLSPRNAAAQCLTVLGQSQERLQEAEKQLGELKGQFGHLVKIDTTPLAHARQRFETLRGDIGRQMHQADALTQKAQNTKKDMQGKALAALDRPETRRFLPQVQAAMAPPIKDLWAEQALALVRQGRYDLSLDAVRMTALRNLGLRPASLKRAMLALIPCETQFIHDEWGLEPGQAATLPAGLVLAAHQGARITRLAVRQGPLEKDTNDFIVPGSADTPFSAGLSPGKCLVRVADPLEAWLVEQDAGDFVGAVALPQADAPVDKDTAELLKNAPRLLVTLYARDPLARDWEFAPWRAAYPQAEPLPLPEKSALLDAHRQGVSLEDWILAALGPEQKPFLPEDSPFRVKEGPPAAGLTLPKLDAQGLYQAHSDVMQARMAPVISRGAQLKEGLTAKVNALIDKARGQMRKDGLAQHGIDPEACFHPPAADPKPEGFMAGMDLSAKYDHIRATLEKAGQLTPERAAALNAQENRMTPLLAESRARWAEGRARLPGKGGFVVPEWAKELLAPLHIDPQDTEVMTREKVLARHADGISLKGKNLSNLDLSGVDLRGADLRGAQLQKTSFAGARLDGADLSGVLAEEADFTGAAFTNGKAVRAILNKALFSKAALSGTDFSRALLKEADLSGAELSGATLIQTLLEKAVLAGARLREVKASQGYFMAADLTGADFSHAQAPKAVFHRATIAQTDFSGSHLSQAIFWDARGDQVVFRDSDLSNARFGGCAAVKKSDFINANLENASMIDTDLSEGVFKGSRLPRAYLRNCNLSRADLSGVNAKGAFFHRSDLEGANLSGANFMLGSLRKARLVNANLSSTNLYGAEMYRAVVGNTDFSAANLKMTLLNQRVELLDDSK